jgi:hypothetical protein
VNLHFAGLRAIRFCKNRWLWRAAWLVAVPSAADIALPQT